MHRFLRALLYGLVAFAVFSGVSWTVGGRVNWLLAAATAIGFALAVLFIAPRRAE
jgi:hypothetical protein